MAFFRSFEACSGSIRETSPDPSGDARNQNAWQVFDRDALLFHRIALAQGHGVAKRCIFLAERFEIDRHAKWRSNFILAPITTADCAALIIENEHVRPEKIDNLLRLGHELFVILQQREHAALNRRHPRMKTRPDPVSL